MIIFFNILDVGGIAALMLLWTASNPHWNENPRKKRRKFLKDLAFDLVSDQFRRRFENPRVMQKGVRLTFAALGYEMSPASSSVQDSSQLTSRRRCAVCPSRSTADTAGDRKTKTSCQICDKPICKSHQCITCFDSQVTTLVWATLPQCRPVAHGLWC